MPDEMPADPFRTSGNRVMDDLAQAGRLWDAIADLEGGQAVAAVNALDEAELRSMVLGQVIFRKFRFGLDLRHGEEPDG